MLARIKTQFKKLIKALRSNKGGEYTSTKFKEFCKDHDVMQQFTQTNSPHQNGVVEQQNRTFIEQAKNLAFGANILVCLWVETINITNYLINLSPIRANGGLTRHQQLFGVPPYFHHLRVVGCVSFVFINAHRAKWSPKSLHFVFIGYNSTSKGYCCFLLEKHKFIVSKDVIFYEDHFNFPPAIIIVSTITKPCITPPIIPFLQYPS
jgi:hypothetical protein